MSAVPLHRPLTVASVPEHGLSIEIVADEAERAALAAETEVESIERLVARLEVRHAGRDGLEVQGVVEASATRLCVVTLEPFIERVREPVEMRFAPARDTPSRAYDADDDDPPDEIVGGAVDLGAVAAEFFTLGLDPHPRKPGAVFDASAADGSDAASPFDALRNLKSRAGDPD